MDSRYRRALVGLHAEFFYSGADSYSNNPISIALFPLLLRATTRSARFACSSTRNLRSFCQKEGFCADGCVHLQNTVTTIRSKSEENFSIEVILGGLIISCLFAGYRLFQVASLADDVKKYAALQNGQKYAALQDGQGPNSRKRSASLALFDTLQLRDTRSQDSPK